MDLSCASGAALHVVHVAAGNDDLLAEDRRADSARELDIGLLRIGAREGDFATHIVTGEAPSTIGMVADKLDADVVVLGRRRTDPTLHDRPLGGTAYAVMSRSRAPCLAITEPLNLPIRKALVAIDRSETARGALLVALSLVSAVRAGNSGEKPPTLTALHVDPGASTMEDEETVGQKTIEHELNILRRNAEAFAGVVVLGETVQGRDPATTIANYARDHDSELVVLGTRPPERRESGLGSVSASVTSRLSIAVLLVPPAVWRDHAKDIDYF